MAKQGMTRALVSFERRMKQTTGMALFLNAVTGRKPLREAVAAAGGRTVPIAPPLPKGPRPNPFA